MNLFPTGRAVVRAAAAVTVGVAALAGCSSSKPRPGSAAIPKNPTPAELATIAPTLAPCTKEKLAAAIVESNPKDDKGTASALVVLANRGDEACQLSGTPRVQAYGDVLATKSIGLQESAGTIDDPNPLPSAPVALLAGQKAEKQRGNAAILLTWKPFDAASCPAGQAPVLAFDVVLPAGLLRLVTPEPNLITPCAGKLAIQSIQPTA